MSPDEFKAAVLAELPHDFTFYHDEDGTHRAVLVLEGAVPQGVTVWHKDDWQLFSSYGAGRWSRGATLAEARAEHWRAVKPEMKRLIDVLRCE